MVKRLWMIMIVMGLLCHAAYAGNARYGDVLRRHHREAQVFSFEMFAADIIWNAVWLSPEMRQSLWEREAKITEKPAEVTSPIIRAHQVQGTQFLVNLYAPKDTDVFTVDDSSFWTATLVKGDDVYRVIKIEPIEITPLVRRLCPFIDRWGKLYLVTFLPEIMPPFTFRMVGATAKSTLHWK